MAWFSFPRSSGSSIEPNSAGIRDMRPTRLSVWTRSHCWQHLQVPIVSVTRQRHDFPCCRAQHRILSSIYPSVAIGLATSIGIDRVGSVPSTTLNVSWAVPLIGRMCIATTHSSQSSSLCNWLHLLTQYQKCALSMALCNRSQFRNLRSTRLNRQYQRTGSATMYDVKMTVWTVLVSHPCACTSHNEYSTTELCLSVDKLKKKKKQTKVKTAAGKRLCQCTDVNVYVVYNLSHVKTERTYTTQDCCAWLGLQFGFGCACLMWCHATSFLVLDLWFPLIELEKSERLLLLNPKDQELVFHPGVNLHQEIWARLLLICVRPKVCFLHILLIGTKVWLPKMHNVPPEVDFESSRSLPQSQSLETVPICIV